MSNLKKKFPDKLERMLEYGRRHGLPNRTRIETAEQYRNRKFAEKEAAHKLKIATDAESSNKKSKMSISVLRKLFYV